MSLILAAIALFFGIPFACLIVLFIMIGNQPAHMLNQEYPILCH